MEHVVDRIEPKSTTPQREEVLKDYRIAYMSRQVSLIGRREALSGKAKFGIFGAGKEVAQIALAKVFRRGDFRAGYYRDQTLMFALGMVSVEEFFAQLYAHADVNFDPNSAGRQMNAHFATRLLRGDGSWKSQTEMFNTSADLSPTGSQMPRLVGLAYASRLYRELEELRQFDDFSHNGNEIAFGTIGNASTAEGMFWESINAAGVLKVPMLLSVWDDRYGISVHNEYQMVKGSISEILEGFRRDPGKQNGYDIYRVRAWDYPALLKTYREAAQIARQEHVPTVVHVVEATQPQGHSSSGSQERYKPAEELAWDREHDCLVKMREWMLEQGLATASELDHFEELNRREVESIAVRSREAYLGPIREERDAVASILEVEHANAKRSDELRQLAAQLRRTPYPYRRHTLVTIRDALILLRDEAGSDRWSLITWKKRLEEEGRERYSSHLYSQSSRSALEVEEVKAVYGEESPMVSGFEILNAAFDDMFTREPRLIAFGQDVGRLGDVNQGMAGLQKKYGPLRVSDAGIRETTIVGQAIGMALRGLRPLAEIQYLDYLLYALQIMSDDLATLHWRTKGGQIAPVIIRTRGHRLEGIWHAGSPMAGIIHLLRGMRVLVPRDMTQAAGFYNTLLQSDEPGLVVEVLNGYRLKERMPENIGELTTPVGVPEILRPGDDVTLVTYGALCRIALEAADLLSKVDIDVEVIDVQSLLPFDVHGIIVDSLKKTGRIVFVDEDVPGGTTAYLMQEVIEKQGGFWWLDSEPRTLSAQPHRPAYGSDGDYWSKPNTEQIFEAVYDMMNEAESGRYPVFYR